MKTYVNPAAFRVALSNRLGNQARAVALPVARVRTIAVMERFLARVFEVFPSTTVLKGGLALELRLARARATKDIDLRLLGHTAAVEAMIARAAALRVSPDDFLTFTVAPDPHHPKFLGEGVVYEGFRYNVTPSIGGERYGDPFGLDVSFADAVHGDPVELIGGDAFDFVGVPPVRVRAYPPGSHLAEKLHAYTLPRPAHSENSRVKDLPDMALLATIDALDAEDLRIAIAKTFAFRGTHAVPTRLPDPPASWVERYRRIAAEEGLPWLGLGDLVKAVRLFLDPILAGATGTWDTEAWTWRR